jgi:hypothetical protein
MSDDPSEPANLRFLRRLVTVLTATMIAGFLVLIATLVIRFPERGVELPETITLPEGVEASAFTVGRDWYAIVTADDRILIYDRGTGELRQTVVVE